MSREISSHRKASRGFGKRVRDQFFTQVSPDSLIWRCKRGKERKDSQRGYENFVSHVQTAHPEDLTVLISDTCSSSNTSERSADCRPLFYSQKTLNTYGWISLVVKALLPFNTTTHPEFRSFSRYGHIHVKTLTMYMDFLTIKVEEKVAAMLPNKLAINFQSWSAGITHYVAVYCTDPSKSSENGLDQLL